MNKLPIERRAQILGMMVEGNSIRAIVSMTGASKNTIIKRLEDAGEAFSAYQDQAFRNLSCKRIQLDEIWAFCYAKQRNVMTAKAAPEDAGDLWTWVALCADSKLVPSWRIGDRSGATAIEFVCDLSGRLANRVQVTSDGHRAYLEAGVWRGCRLRSVHQAVRRGSAPPQAATARHRYRAARPTAAPGSRTRAISARATSSGRTSRCASRCAGSPADQRLLKKGGEPRTLGRDPLHASFGR